MLFEKKISMITIFVFVLSVLIWGNASATVHLYYDAEDATVGDLLPWPVDNGVVFFNDGAGNRGTIQSAGGTPQGSKYFQWEIAHNQHDNGTKVRLKANGNQISMTNIYGKTVYLAFYIRFDRIGGNDLWHEGGQSTDKCLELDGSGMRWTVGFGQWDKCRGGAVGFMTNQDHRFSTYGGNPSYHLNPDLETYGANMAGYSCSNTPQLEYDVWHSVILGVTVHQSNGARRQWLNGVLVSEDTGIPTTDRANPDIDYIGMFGTFAQPAYDIPAHVRKVDALMLTDDWNDIIEGGYIQGGGTTTTTTVDTTPPDPPTNVRIEP